LSETAAIKDGYTIAVPRPRRMLPHNHHPKLLFATVRKIPPACTHIPATIKPFRPHRSLKGPVRT
jgi:hypothetical protein